MTTTKTRWVRTDSTRDHDAWELRAGDEVLVELERDRPTRWHLNGVSGSVVDMDAPVSWLVTLWNATGNSELHSLKEGLTLMQAKAEVIGLIAAAKAS